MRSNERRELPAIKNYHALSPTQQAEERKRSNSMVSSASIISTASSSSPKAKEHKKRVH